MSKFLKNTNLLLFLLLSLNFISLPSTSQALSPEPRLENEEDEKRARQLFLEIRCLVCAGQVIESSDNEFSASMRQFIRDEIKSGKTNKDIKNYLIERYGNDIIIETKDFLRYNMWLIPISLLLIYGYKISKKIRKN